jgi:FAD dependent oxidoreductase TIGR03364
VDERSYDDVVLGAGVLGLAHAYHLARRGRRVLVVERSPRAAGASVRNFGMLWPIGQPAGEMRALARRSLELWSPVLREAGVWHERTGSLHLAYHEDEEAVLGEFARAAAQEGEDCALLTAEQVVARSPAVAPKGLRAGLWSPSETCVDPREVVAELPGWLQRRHGVEFVFGRAVTGFDSGSVWAGEARWKAGNLFACPGDDLATLFPEALAPLGLRRCKLQMLRSQPFQGWRIGPMLAGGLTLRHYAAFADCPSLPALRRRVAEERPEWDRYGIHVMVSQNGRGELVLGDSHEYDAAIEPFDKREIEDLVLEYLGGFLRAPGLRVVARWNGTYVKHPTRPWCVVRPAPGVHVVTGVGGAGMTLSFGLAERVVAEALGEA